MPILNYRCSFPFLVSRACVCLRRTQSRLLAGVWLHLVSARAQRKGQTHKPAHRDVTLTHLKAVVSV